MKTTVALKATTGNAHDPQYDGFVASLGRRFNSQPDEPMFETDATGLFEAYLAGFPASERQFHNCWCCRRCIERYAGLVRVTSHGTTVSAVWDDQDCPPEYRQPIRNMLDLVNRASITAPFLSSQLVLGQPKTGCWTHLFLPNGQVFARTLQTAGQRAAELVQDFVTTLRAVDEYQHPHVRLALDLLEGDELYRSEKVAGPVKWLDGLQASIDAIRPKRYTKATRSAFDERKRNLIWRAIATAPAGFAHLRNGMAGTLLDDLHAGMSIADAARRFADKMHPLRYQRPTAAPSAGTVRAANATFNRLDAAGSLKRRHALLSDLKLLWLPKASKVEVQTGPFSGLDAKSSPITTGQSTDVSWAYLTAKVLPRTQSMQVLVLSTGQFTAYTTASDPDAPPIIQWDGEQQRNPVAWYMYAQPSTASRWGLTVGWADVTGVSSCPAHWYGSSPNFADAALLVISGCHDSNAVHLGLFPEIMKSEFHGIRSALEAYAATHRLEGRSTASGLLVSNGGQSVTVRVQRAGRWMEYRVTSWE